MLLMMIFAGSFFTVVLIVLGSTMQNERQIMMERMEVQARGVIPASDYESIHTPFRDRIVLPLLRRLAALGMKMTPGGAAQSMDARLETAGRPWGMGAREYAGLRVFCLGVFVLFGILVSHKFPQMTLLLKLVMFSLFVLIGLVIPDAALNSTISTRQSSIRKTLPDTLDLLTVSVESGLGLDGAIQKVVDKLNNPLSDELQRALQEMRIGKRRGEALRDMAARANVSELSIFVAAVCQAEQLGVSISKVLKVQSDTLRAARAIHAREAATKLPVRMLFPLIFCIFPSLFVVVLSPGAIQIGRALGLLQR